MPHYLRCNPKRPRSQTQLLATYGRVALAVRIGFCLFGTLLDRAVMVRRELLFVC